MVPTTPEPDNGKPRRPDQYLLTLRSLVLLLVGAGTVILSVRDPRWGAAVLVGVTVLGILAKMVKLQVRYAAGRTRRAPRSPTHTFNCD
jgi:hypothetical protein